MVREALKNIQIRGFRGREHFIYLSLYPLNTHIREASPVDIEKFHFASSKLDSV